ncbi:MAG: adenine phosphoribosyltransferase [bacterium]
MTAARGGSGPSDDDVRERIARALRVVPDFPSPGILFQDITPVLADASLLAAVVAALAEPWRDARITHVAGVESRGFILAAPVAVALGVGFIPVRKPGKLPSRSVGRDYALEYGTGRLEMHEDACTSGSRVLLVDDVLATGGTARAACELVESVGASVVACSFMVAIASLHGERMLRNHEIAVLVHR